jgi:hypothetical protein
MVEELLGRSLAAAERLSWLTQDEEGQRDRGPVRLVFDTGHALVVSGTTSWTIDTRITESGDDSWLDIVNYDIEGGRWVLRDASSERPFADAVGTRLTAWQPVFNEVQEVVGVCLAFGDVEVPLVLSGGEVAT